VKSEVSILDNKRFDKEYSTQYSTEMMYLKECGIPYTFVKKVDGVTVWKYHKSYRLFDTLKNFYKNN